MIMLFVKKFTTRTCWKLWISPVMLPNVVEWFETASNLNVTVTCTQNARMMFVR